MDLGKDFGCQKVITLPWNPCTIMDFVETMCHVWMLQLMKAVQEEYFSPFASCGLLEFSYLIMGSSKCFSASSTEMKGCMVIISAPQKDGEKNAQWSFKWQTMGFEECSQADSLKFFLFYPLFCFILAMHYVCLCNTCPITPKLFLCLLYKWEVELHGLMCGLTG